MVGGYQGGDYDIAFCSVFLRCFTDCTGNARYYEGGVSSVYFWDLDDGFAGVVLLKKSKVTSYLEVHRTDSR